MAKTMSGSGGFYKYRCKYFYTKSCQNWVYVNGEACMSCLVSFGSTPWTGFTCFVQILPSVTNVMGADGDVG